ncbi:NUDIX hydrolase [Rhodospirillaceae bacterium SYSU D60014]|uniref:NUDIX hydrolase n=1 Tax=Virgifigura deserti TaxID=2268457 RepID=UPI000E6689E6
MTRSYPDRPVVGVIAVVWREDSVLLVRRANPPDAGKWGFPGGKQHLGETIFDAAMRELREETGVVAEPSEVVTAVDVIERDEAGRVRYQFTLVAVLGIWQAGEGVADDDADAVAWVRPDDLARGEMILSADVEEVIRLSAERLTPPHGSTSSP